jgi:ketopantoate reductase
MAGDLPHGPTETEHYNGHLVRLADGLPCPLNRAVLEMVAGIIASQGPLSIRRVEALAALT